MPWAQTHSDLSPHLSLHTSACALVSACCSFLPSFSQHVSLGTSDSPSCTFLPLTHMLVCMHITTVHVHGGRRVRIFSCVQCYLHLTVSPVQRFLHFQRQQSGRCLNGFRTLCRRITGSHRKWPDTHTCFLSSKITLRQAQWEFQADRPAALCLVQTNRVCAGRLCFSCQKQLQRAAGPATTPPDWSFISSQRCHEINTSSAIALCLPTCLAAHSDVPCPLVLCPTPLLFYVPHILLWFPSYRLVSGPAEKPPPGVRSGVIYHSRLRGELTFVQTFCSAIVIDSPCLFEDTNRYNYVRTPLSYILPISVRKTTGELSFCIS